MISSVRCGEVSLYLSKFINNYYEIVTIAVGNCLLHFFKRHEFH